MELKHGNVQANHLEKYRLSLKKKMVIYLIQSNNFYQVGREYIYILEDCYFMLGSVFHSDLECS